MLLSTVYHTTNVVEYGLQCTSNLLWNLTMSDTDTGVQWHILHNETQNKLSVHWQRLGYLIVNSFVLFTLCGDSPSLLKWPQKLHSMGHLKPNSFVRNFLLAMGPWSPQWSTGQRYLTKIEHDQNHLHMLYPIIFIITSILLHCTLIALSMKSTISSQGVPTSLEQSFSSGELQIIIQCRFLICFSASLVDTLYTTFPSPTIISPLLKPLSTEISSIEPQCLYSPLNSALLMSSQVLSYLMPKLDVM